MGRKGKKTDRKRKQAAGLEMKIMILIFLFVAVSFSCIFILINTLESVADVSNEIVTVRVDEQQQILELSRKFTYINGQVLTHVMTTNKVTMEELKTKIQAEIIQMDTQLNAFAECLPENDKRRDAFQKATDQYTKYKRTVESLLETSATNKTQAYVSATSNLPMFNESIEACMNEMRDITGEQMDQAYEGMSQRVENIPRIVVGATWILTGAMVLILIGIKLWVTSPVKKATRQVDVLVEGIRKGEGDITRRRS